MRWVTVVCLVVALAGISCDEESEPGTQVDGTVRSESGAIEASERSIPDGRPVITIYSDSLGKGRVPCDPYQSKQAVALIWADGAILWSDDRLNGGMPYRVSRVHPDAVSKLLGDVESTGVFRDKDFRRSYLGPDAEFMGIRLRNGDRTVEMQSWHECFEERENLVATVGGITILNGRTREEVLADQPEDYQRFRGLWRMVREGVEELIPEDGPIYAGNVSIEH